MLYRVTHETRYDYSEPAVISHNQAHLLPRSSDRQSLRKLQLRINPTPNKVDWHKDYYGNDVVFFALQVPHDRLVVRTESNVDVMPRPALQLEASPAWEDVVHAVRKARDAEGLAAFDMVWDSPFVSTGERFADYARGSFTPGRPIAVALLDLNARIHGDFNYDPEATTLATPIGEVLEQRHGVCQDFAHLMIGCLRSLGLPARYVSGYLQSAEPEEPAGGETDELVGSEASHAWVSSWCPVNGWIDLDPTNNVVPSDRHVVLAYGRDYDDVSPLKGVTLGGGAHSVDVQVEARPVADDDDEDDEQAEQAEDVARS